MVDLTRLPADAPLPGVMGAFWRIARGISIVLVMLGMLVLVGWQLKVLPLLSILPGFPLMKPNSALCFVLTGLSLWLWSRQTPALRSPWVARLLVLPVILIGLLSLSQYAFNVSLGIDELLFEAHPLDPSRLPPNRPNPFIAAVFLLAGIVLLLFDVRAIERETEGLAWLAFIIAVLAVTAVTYNVNVVGFEAQHEIAIHTSLGMTLLSLAMLFARPQIGLMRLVSSSALGGVTLRRLLPAALIIPLVIGFLRLLGERRGIYESSAGTALFAAANVLTLFVVIFLVGGLLSSLDREREQARLTAIRARDFYLTLFEASPGLIWRSDVNGQCNYVNQTWRVFTGCSLEQALGQGWLAEIHPEDVDSTRQRYQEAFSDRAAVVLEYRLLHRSGEYRWVLDHRRPYEDLDGEFAGFISTSSDIHDRRMMEEHLRQVAAELERSNRELQDFAYIASHDLQEPLRKIQAFGDRVKTKNAGILDDQSRDYLERMLNAASRMQSLIQDVLRYSRVSTQAQPFAPVDLNKVVQEVLSDMEIAVERAQARIDISGSLPTLLADQTQMNQLFQNLIGNALKFRRDNLLPRITITGRVLTLTGVGLGPQERTTRRYEIAVSDNGIGFDPKYRERIFSVFERLHGRDANYEGTGMGLAICRKIVERHQGTITADSIPGQGSTFTIQLPLQSQEIVE